MKSVSCASVSMCMAVGKTGGNHSVVERWDGTEWLLVQSTEGEIRKIACASTTACIAVGTSSTGAAQSWPMFELSGNWVVLEMAPPMPPTATEAALNGIDCIGTVCTAVGFYKSGSSYFPLVERWNGSAWSQQEASSPLEGSGPNVMLGVSCASETSCVAVGEAGGKPFAQSWNGSIWSATSVPNPSGATGAKLASVSCTSSSFCIGVGDYFETSGNEKTLVERWNGSAWSLLSSPNPSDAKGYVNFTDVSCLSSSSCFAVGDYASKLSGGVPLEVKTLAEGWNGTAWTIQPSPNATGKPYNALLGVSCVSASACTAVGSYSEALLGGRSAMAERWNGSAWSLQNVAIDDSATVGAVNDSVTVSEDVATPIGALTKSDNLCLEAGAPGGQSLSVAFKQNRRRQITVAFGASAEIEGQLTDASGQPLAGASICVETQILDQRDSGSLIARPKTDVSGHFSYPLSPGPSRAVTIVYRDGARQLKRRLLYFARARPSLHASPLHLRNGQLIHFQGRLPRPGAGGCVVILQATAAGSKRWITFQRATTNGHGAFRSGYHFTSTSHRTRYRFRAVVPRQTGYPWAEGHSKAVKVTVNP